ncbi:MAG: hypothetical protein IKS09_07810, partial [Lachnospiraceae bacterium]|nr:hypothetical protein [Lachnospiraceae bacterium]
FKEKTFLHDVKEFFTDIINDHVINDAEKLKVFPSNSPYIATKKIGKNNICRHIDEALERAYEINPV